MPQVEAAAKARRAAARLSGARSSASIARGDYALIAEIKKASPSKGLIRADFDPPALARAYEAGGAACLSVLTDAPSFQGEPEFLDRGARGDHAAGAAQGFHVRALSGGGSARAGRRLHPDHHGGGRRRDGAAIWKTPRSHSAWTCWSRSTTRTSSSARCELRSRLIGINNRDLQTFETTLATSERLAPQVPRDRIVVGESGIFTPADLARLAKAGISTFLIGESLMRQADVTAATRALARAQAPPRSRASSQMAKKLTHLDKRGEARMVDVSAKAATERIAIAEGRVVMRKSTLELVLNGNAKKGDVLGAARIAGIMAAKRTHELIPLCHPLRADQGRGRYRAGPHAARLRRARDRQGEGPDRRRDGGADRGLGRLPDHLRHGQGGRARHAHRGHPPGREARRQVRRSIAREGVQADMSAR